MNDNYEDTHIAVVGAGYVGLVTASCFASFGFQVSVIEKDPKKLKFLESGSVPIYEPGLTEIFEEALEEGRLKFYASASDLYKVHKPKMVFIAVGTPQAEDGACDLSYVWSATREVIPFLEDRSVLVLKSTVPVGTADKLRELVSSMDEGRNIAVVNNPEFLKEGSAVADFMRPERVVLGGRDSWALEMVKGLYDPLLHNGRPVFVTDSSTAELAKLGANLMLASRVSLINQISRLASDVGGNVRQVESILRADSRIGSKYLYAGLGYGGSCFPKDVKSFIHICKERGLDASLAESVDSFNDSQKLFFIPFIQKHFPNPQNTIVSMLGVAFKPETDDIRESPALSNVKRLRALGYRVKVYDPKALPQFQQWLASEKIDGVEICDSIESCLSNSQVLFLMTEWQEFQRLGLGPIRKLFQGSHVLDGKNIFRPETIRNWGYVYKGVGQQ